MLMFKDYLKRRFGRPLFRVPIDPPFPCPHRVADGGRGCAFCAEDGARARHLRHGLDLGEQISRGVEYVRRRYGAEGGLIAYFQSFTPTNAPVDDLRRFYLDALGMADFDMAIVATRPDCLPDDVLAFLAELNSRLPLWVELGVQTANDATLRLVNRGHDFQATKDAAIRLHAAGIESAAHIILGLPGEDLRDFRATADAVSALPFSAVKIHNLLVLKNTPLAAEYAGRSDGSYPEIRPMDEYEYADALAEVLPRFPRDWPIMRLVADAPPERVVAPKWWMSKGRFLEYLKRRLANPAPTAGMPAVETGDGSPTLYHPGYRQHFHTTAGAASETVEKFLKPVRLEETLSAGRDVSILDVGFGLGLNALSAAALAERVRGGRVDILSLEIDRKAVEAALALAMEGAWSGAEAFSGIDVAGILERVLAAGRAEGTFFSLELRFGDARAGASSSSGPFDAVFLDPFSPDANPELWTYDFIRLLAGKLSERGVVATYSGSMPVRGAMARAGLLVGATAPFGRRRSGTIASFDPGRVESPLDAREMAILLESTAGVAYRDPPLDWDRVKIRAFRAKLVTELRRRGVPKWLKRSSRND